nr:MAG TPA: hypothetical protein [Caudoviricetes sp.]
MKYDIIINGISLQTIYADNTPTTHQPGIITVKETKE